MRGAHAPAPATVMLRYGAWRENGLALPGAAEVDVWMANLDDAAPCLPSFDELLPAHERDERERLVRADSRRMFTLSRGLRRALLGEYLQIAPASVRFAHGRTASRLCANRDALLRCTSMYRTRATSC